MNVEGSNEERLYMNTQDHVRRPSLKDYSPHHKVFSLIKAIAWVFLILSPITPLLFLWLDVYWTFAAGSFLLNLVTSLLFFAIGFGGAAISDIAESNNKLSVIQWEARQQPGKELKQ
jgi:hypothetical protein